MRACVRVLLVMSMQGDSAPRSAVLPVPARRASPESTSPELVPERCHKLPDTMQRPAWTQGFTSSHLVRLQEWANFYQSDPSTEQYESQRDENQDPNLSTRNRAPAFSFRVPEFVRETLEALPRVTDAGVWFVVAHSLESNRRNPELYSILFEGATSFFLSKLEARFSRGLPPRDGLPPGFTYACAALAEADPGLFSRRHSKNQFQWLLHPSFVQWFQHVDLFECARDADRTYLVDALFRVAPFVEAPRLRFPEIAEACETAWVRVLSPEGDSGSLIPAAAFGSLSSWAELPRLIRAHCELINQQRDSLRTFHGLRSRAGFRFFAACSSRPECRAYALNDEVFSEYVVFAAKLDTFEVHEEVMSWIQRSFPVMERVPPRLAGSRELFDALEAPPREATPPARLSMIRLLQGGKELRERFEVIRIKQELIDCSSTILRAELLAYPELLLPEVVRAWEADAEAWRELARDVASATIAVHFVSRARRVFRIEHPEMLKAFQRAHQYAMDLFARNASLVPPGSSEAFIACEDLPEYAEEMDGLCWELAHASPSISLGFQLSSLSAMAQVGERKQRRIMVICSPSRSGGSPTDRDRASELTRCLRDRFSIPTFENVGPGSSESFEAKMQALISGSIVGALCILSRRFRDSGNCRRLFELAHRLRIPTFFLLMDRQDPYDALEESHGNWLSASEYFKKIERINMATVKKKKHSLNFAQRVSNLVIDKDLRRLVQDPKDDDAELPDEFVRALEQENIGSNTKV